MKTVCTNAVAGSTSAALDMGEPRDINARTFYTYHCWGTFGGAKLVLEVSVNGTNWAAIPYLDIGDNSAPSSECRYRYLRARVQGGDGTTSLNCVVA